MVGLTDLDVVRQCERLIVSGIKRILREGTHSGAKGTLENLSKVRKVLSKVIFFRNTSLFGGRKQCLRVMWTSPFIVTKDSNEAASTVCFSNEKLWWK